MDLKIEILESYSRIHNRDLLLEQGGDPEATAKQEFATAQGSNPLPVTSSPYVAQGARAQVAVFTTKQGTRWKFAPMNSNGQPNIGGSRFIDQDWDTFVGYFSEDGEKKGSAGEDQTTDQAGVEVPLVIDWQPGQLTQMAQLSDETKDVVSLNITSLAGRAQEIWDSLTQTMQTTFGHIDKFSDFLAGDSIGSFEKQLVSAKTSLVMVDGEWTKVSEPPQEAQTSLISESFKDLVSMVADGDGGCVEGVMEDFTITDNGVLISPKGDGADRSEALSFRDKNGYTRMLLQKAAAICKKEAEVITSLDQPYKNTTGGDNAIRGFGFEDITEIMSLLRIKRQIKDDKGDYSAIAKLVKKKTILLNKKLNRLTLASEEWIKEYEKSALDPHQADLIMDIARILQGGSKSNDLYASMLKHSNQSVKVRGSNYILPVGNDTGKGKRQDILEIFTTSEEAVAGAERSGLKGVTPTCMPIEEAFKKGSKGTLTALKKAKVFEQGQVVCALKVGLKNYMKLSHAVLGTGGRKTFKELVNTPFNESTLAQTAMGNLGLDETDHASFVEYATSIDKIGDAVFDSIWDNGSVSLNNSKLRNLGPYKPTSIEGPTDFTSVDSTELGFGSKSAMTKKGEKIDQNLAKNFAETVLKDLLKNNDYKDLEGSMSVLKKQAKFIADDMGTSYELNSGMARLQHTLLAFLKHTRLKKDLAAGGNKAKQAKVFMAMEQYHSGGADDNGTILDGRELTTSNNYIMRHNEPLIVAWNSILSDDGVWTLEVTDGASKASSNGKIELKKGKETLTTTTDTVAKKNSKTKKVNGYKTSTSLKLNKPGLESFSTVKNPPKPVGESVELGEILTHIKLLFEKVAIVGIK